MDRLLQITAMLLGATLIVTMIHLAETLPYTQTNIQTILEGK